MVKGARGQVQRDAGKRVTNDAKGLDLRPFKASVPAKPCIFDALFRTRTAVWGAKVLAKISTISDFSVGVRRLRGRP